MTSSDLDKLHGHLAEAESVMSKCRPVGAKMGEFALQCEEYARLLILELNAFSEIVERAKKESDKSHRLPSRSHTKQKWHFG